MNAAMLTTIDNPYNPFTQFDLWYAYDEQMGYHTCSYLARIVDTYGDTYGGNDEIGELVETDRAINEIVDYNILGIYRKVYRDTVESVLKAGPTEEEAANLAIIRGTRG